MATKTTDSAQAKPFLKWVGGKRQALANLRKLYPDSFKRYFEPFVGGGAVFFDLKPKKAVLSDSNLELIECYITVRDHLAELIKVLKKHKYEKNYYYAIRAIDPTGLNMVERAARMIFLNKTGYNGLYRVNSKNKFNVPFGKYVNPKICNTEVLNAASIRLSGATIKHRQFEEILKNAKKGDFVYFDPPYIPVSDTSCFTAYQKHGFGMENQEKLAEVFDKLTTKGIKAMLSNSHVPWIHKTYKKHNIRVIEVARHVNSNAKKRGPVGEVIVTNY